MTLFEETIQLLKEAKVWYELLEHEPVYTSEQAAAVRPDITLHQGAKAMVLKIKGLGPEFMMVVLPGDMKMDYHKVTKFLGVRDVTLASPKEVEQIIGVKVGAVSPFGNLSDLKVLVDASLLENQKIAFNAGDHGKTVVMGSADYLTLSKAQPGDFTKSS
jgi:Ala-tRNA(Pro) deacylase